MLQPLTPVNFFFQNIPLHFAFRNNYCRTIIRVKKYPESGSLMVMK